jgi:glycosyltransferase involved in cell wall biosynthesis
VPEFSIIAPVYKMKNNYGERFLVEYLSHLSYQVFKDYEVIVPDQSEDNNLKNICDTFLYIMNIKHVRNSGELKTAAANVNFGIRHSSGKLVKLLYVDDFFTDPAALLKIKEAFDTNPNGKWLISGFVCCNEDRTKFYNERQPWYGNKYVNGDNVTGNPSNYTVRRECALEMDENLLWIVDGEYFYRSYYHYGDPILVNDILVCFRDHEDSAFKRPDLRELDAKERQYCVDKFNRQVEQKLI